VGSSPNRPSNWWDSPAEKSASPQVVVESSTFDPADLDPTIPRLKSKKAARTRPTGAPFEAELDATELDERGRASTTWTARARELSRSNVVFLSRRMTFPGRLLLLAVHRIDDKPVPLFGKVYQCDYEADGLYRVDLDLLPVPDHRAIRDWVAARGHANSRHSDRNA
jgi:hypothetical protein